MAVGIPTSNILQPANISLSTQNRQLMVDLQILKPVWYNKYTERYGNEDFTWWLASIAGMQKVENRNYFWFENRGKLMTAITNAIKVTTPAVGATVNLTLSSVDNFNAGTESPLRDNETVVIASNNVEGKIVPGSINTTVPNAFTFQVRPLKSTVAFAGPTGSLEVNEILIFGGQTDLGEASTENAPLIPLDIQFNNNITEIADGWSNTDLAQMATTYYEYPVTDDMKANGVSAFTYKGMHKTNVRFKNNVERKLMMGDTQTNTGLSNSVGSQGIIPKGLIDGETIGYTPLNLDIPKFHETTRIMDVNGCDKQVAWLSDMFQRQDFSDGIFTEFPAGAFVWGQGEKSEDASVAYGFQKLYIDEYMFQIKKYKNFNTEYTTGKTPAVDFFRYFGFLYPMGSTADARTATNYNNISVMYQEPPATNTGTIGNGIRLWQYGGGSPNSTDGTMVNKLRMITYRGTRVCAANKLVFMESAA